MFPCLVAVMFPCFRSRVVDQDLLSCWLDDLDMSHRFHLVAFCIIQRYCFVAKHSWVDTVLAHQGPKYSRRLLCVNLNNPTEHHECGWLSKLLDIAIWACEKDVGPNLYILPRQHHCKTILWCDWETKTLQQLPEMLEAHFKGEMVLMNVLTNHKNLVVMGGYQHTSHMFCQNTNNTFVEEFDFEHFQWNPLANMKSKKLLFAKAVVEQNSAQQNHIVVAGGACPEGIPLKTVEMYCRETNVWTSLKELPHAKSRVFATMYNGKMHVGPSYWGNTNIDVFDFHKQDWLVTKGLTHWRNRHPIGTIGTTCHRQFFGCRLVVLAKSKVYFKDDNTDTWAKLRFPSAKNPLLFCL